MNFLAHIYLSGDSDDVLAGNFIGDFVKGRTYLKYPENIRTGILLHRKIDEFTDNHMATRECKSYVNEKYNKYAGVVVDIFYDHFLATHWKNYSSIPLDEYSQKKYKILGKYFEIFPKEVQHFFPNFLKRNWLQAYTTIEGIRSVLERMANWTTIPDFSAFAMEKLKENHTELRDLFFEFFSDIRNYVSTEYSIVLNGK